MKTPRFVRCAVLSAGLMAAAFLPLSAEEEPIAFPAETPGTVEPPDSGLPKLTQRVAPVWPATAKEQSEEVGVYVAFLVTSEGEVKNPRALFGRYPDFEPAAVAAVAQWKLSPGRYAGHPVTTQMIGLVTFTPAKKS